MPSAGGDHLVDEHRPDPDRLLEQIKAQEERSGRGALKIFFGYVAGVGKTYAMLDAAQRLAAAGEEVVVGYVEPHGRVETEVLMEGLEVLPPLRRSYRGVELTEFDLEAALKRHPALLLVDELAHTNAPGSLYAKRWQDVKELLDAGISVYTTLNVQHLESLNDVIAGISGIEVRETIPDEVFDEAASVEVVDLPPLELVERLHQGKIYIPDQAERAVEGFFAGPNLGALREIALRRTADRVHMYVERARLAAAGPVQTWATTETILVCVGPSPTSADVIRSSRRLAASLNARWIAVSVEGARGQASGSGQQHALMNNIHLAERLGAETATVAGANVARDIVDYAHAHNVTKIVIGKTAQPSWKRALGNNIVDQILELSGDIDVCLIHSKRTAEGAPPTLAKRRAALAWPGYATALLACVVAALVAWAFQDAGLAEANKAIVFLLAVAVVAARFGLGPGIATALVGVLAFDFFFVPPYLTFAVADVQFVITFAIMIVVAVIISSLSARLRNQVRASRSRERRSEALYRLSRELSGMAGRYQLAAVAQREIRETFGAETWLYLPDGDGRLEQVVSPSKAIGPGPSEAAVAQWVMDHGHLAGQGTDTLPDAGGLFVPLITPRGTVGVLGVARPEAEDLLLPENRQLLETLAQQIGVAIERDELVEETRGVVLEIERERLRSSLLSSVSHDLRTPLAAIAGASSTLLELSDSADAAQRRDLLQELVEESTRLARLVDNLLNMTRLEAGKIAVDKQWFPLEDVIGSALGRLRQELAGRVVEKHLPEDVPLVPLDGVLMEQALVNLLDNAIKYSPPGSPLEVSTEVDGGEVRVSVGDRGQGLAAGEEKRVFAKLFRGAASAASGERGAGLGLAIVAAIVSAHGGRVWAENRPGGGAIFTMTLPLGESPPDLEDIEREGVRD
jgi:two-component system sensor histidine kinase KdpD